MAGVVLETLSNRKLAILAGVLLLCQIVSFLIGGLVAPSPSNVQVILGTKCLDTFKLDDKHIFHKEMWYYSRGDGACDSVSNLDDKKIATERITANQVVFSFQFPLPRDGIELDMSRWFQNIISVLQIDIDYDASVPLSDNAILTMDARLGYRNKGDGPSNWTEIVRSTEERKLSCTMNKNHDSEHGYPMECEMLPFFELGSCHHDFYLLNIRLPVHEKKGTNMGIGKVQDFWLVTIHQNGGFTKVWLSLKTVFFPAIMVVMVWFWRRITLLDRPPVLLEKTLLGIGLALTLLNLPLEWLTLWIDLPFMLLIGDIRQGIFYAALLSFWIIFAGEHMMDSIERNRLVLYWKHLGAVVFGCVCLFVFELCERGVQLTNPFYSIWATETGTNLALGFIILAGIAACIYFLFLSYMVFKVFRNISSKKSALPSMSSSRRKYYSGLIFRFKFMMLATLLCAALTVIFFIIGQVSEGHWKWGDDHSLQYTSAFFTGVYGMWNVYAFCLLALYAPSHKQMSQADTTSPLNPVSEQDSQEEEVEFTAIPSEASALSAFVRKAAAD